MDDNTDDNRVNYTAYCAAPGCLASIDAPLLHLGLGSAPRWVKNDDGTWCCPKHAH